MCIWQQYYDQEVLDGGFFSKRASYILCRVCGFALIFRNKQNYLQLSHLPGSNAWSYQLQRD